MHLYLHIPFCRQACHYCDFHFSTNLRSKEALVKAMAKEIEMQSAYLPEKAITTIYFGGGTPSLLSQQEINFLLTTIRTHFDVHPQAEITLEANPDDLSREVLNGLVGEGVNRLSIGIQSFHEPHLRFMNRAHSALEAEKCVGLAKEAGISSISIDLIYALPAPDNTLLTTDIQKAVSLGVGHISAYCLTIEPQTAFGKWVSAKKMAGIEEDFAAAQFELLVDRLHHHGYEQYEISNFARDQQYSKHNTAYWQRHPYLGIGPSAHSYNSTSRQYNVSSNAAYLKALDATTLPATVEVLSRADQVNEYLLTGLRTKWGCRLDFLEELAQGTFQQLREVEIGQFVDRDWLRHSEGLLLLTQKGKLFADRIASELFLENEA